jgi:hypothetical protein
VFNIGYGEKRNWFATCAYGSPRKLHVSMLLGSMFRRGGQALVDARDFIHACFYDLVAAPSSRSSEVQLF